jgi:predicted aspartyl protease
MIRYKYNTQVDPPAPFVLVTLRNPADGAELREVPAQIDTAADLTVLPSRFAHDLGLSEIGQARIVGLGGVSYSASVFVVLLGIHDSSPTPLRVVSSVDEPWVLLGRDVLNTRRMVLDGPELALEIG